MKRRGTVRQAATRLEWLLWVVAIASVGYTCLWSGEVYAARWHAQSIGQAMPEGGPAASAATAPDAPKQASSVMGRLEIPGIGLAVPVMADFDPASLRRGVGHIQGTALPGGLGTLGLAGHRDTFFRPLAHIAKGMDIRVTDASGTYHYRVDGTEIVTPDQVQVLDIRNEPKLTLITCYPFDFIGQAPKRFIVHANLVSLEPDAPAHTH